jgi:hypothetical protein
MHVDVPKLPMDSFKDLAKHYLMIVLGILTALGLEAWIEHQHHVDAARTASVMFDEELRANLDNVQKSIAQNIATMQKLDKLDDMVTADMQNGTSSALINQQIRAHREDFQLNVQTPDVSTSAWDVAVANQSVSWIAPDKLRIYSTAYADLRSISSWEHYGLLAILNAPKTLDLITDIKKGRDVDPIVFQRAVEQLHGTMHSANSNLDSIVGDLSAALPKDTQH